MHLHRQLARTVAITLSIAAFGTATTVAAKAPETWDGLVRAKSKRFQLVYLRPGATFSQYHKIMLTPAEVAFRKNWQRDYNRSASWSSGRVSDADVRQMLDEGRGMTDEAFAAAFRKAGYEVVSEPGADVVRIGVAVTNVSVTAPDVSSSARARTYSRDAGEATLAIEARDSLSGELLGRAIDRRTAGESLTYRRTESSNRADFEQLVQDWAKASARGLGEIKAATGAPPK